jgi:hypothetical protein
MHISKMYVCQTESVNPRFNEVKKFPWIKLFKKDLRASSLGNLGGVFMMGKVN